MNRKALFFFACFLLLFCVACEAKDPSVGAINQSNANAVMATTATVVASSGGPADTSSTNTTPTTTTNSQPTSPPAVPTKAATSTGYHSCTAQSCDNPWGFVLGCSCPYQQVTIAPPGFCSWFHCIPNFNNESGTIGECGDGEFSHAGGLSGMCSGHQGLINYLYIKGTTTITPTPIVPTPTPRPSSTPKPTPNPTLIPPSPTPILPVTPVPTAN